MLKQNMVFILYIILTTKYYRKTSKFGELWSPPGNNFDLEVGQGQDQGHCMVPNERARYKDHACQISMLYNEYFRRYEPG